MHAHRRYSNGDAQRCYAFCPWFPDKSERQLLLVRAVVGVPCEHGGAILTEQERKMVAKPPEQEPGVLFDSVRGGPHRPGSSGPGECDSAMVVLYDLAQAYPEYVVTYRV